MGPPGGGAPGGGAPRAPGAPGRGVQGRGRGAPRILGLLLLGLLLLLGQAGGAGAARGGEKGGGGASSTGSGQGGVRGEPREPPGREGGGRTLQGYDAYGPGGIQGGEPDPAFAEGAYRDAGGRTLKQGGGPEDGRPFNYLNAFYINLEEWLALDAILLPGLLSLTGLQATLFGNTPSAEALFGLVDILSVFGLSYDLRDRSFNLGPQVLGISSQVDLTMMDSTPTWALGEIVLFTEGLGILSALGLSDPDYENPGFPWILLPRRVQDWIAGLNQSLFTFEVYDGSVLDALGDVAEMLRQLWMVSVSTTF